MRRFQTQSKKMKRLMSTYCIPMIISIKWNKVSILRSLLKNYHLENQNAWRSLMDLKDLVGLDHLTLTSRYSHSMKILKKEHMPSNSKMIKNSSEEQVGNAIRLTSIKFVRMSRYRYSSTRIIQVSIQMTQDLVLW